MPYDAGPYGPPGGNPYVAPKKSRKGLYIALSVLGVVLLLGIGAVVIGIYALKDTAIAANLKVGDCLTDVPEDSRVLLLPTTDCAQPHGGEVYAVLTLPDGAYLADFKKWEGACANALADFAPTAIEDDSVGMYLLHPTEETWKGGDREITCIATLNPKRSGSLEESGSPAG